MKCPNCGKDIVVPEPTLEKNFYHCPFCGTLLYLYEESHSILETARAEAT